MVDKDVELHGPRLNAVAFVVLSDGQAWSGEVERALRLTRERGVRVYVVGVGTTAGGFIPQLPRGRYDEPEPPIHAVLDRRSLRAIADAGRRGVLRARLGARRGHRPPHRARRPPVRAQRPAARGDVHRLYWYCLAAAAALLALGALALQDRTELWWQLAAAGALLALLL